MSEIGIELISERCKDCPCLELETITLAGGKKQHRCMNLQMCRAVLAYWKEQEKFKGIELLKFGDE